VTYYLRLDGIDGESMNRGHEKWFELAAFSWGVQSTLSPGRGGGAGVGRPVLEPVHATLRGAQGVPALFQTCTTGRHIAAATLDIVATGEQPRSILKADLADVLVSSVELSGADGADLAAVVTLAYGKVTLTASTQDPNGAIVPGIPVGWDLGRNRLG
jgi:type VI secretion system secreted protein Hcp